MFAPPPPPPPRIDASATIYKETHGLIPNNINLPTKVATILAAYMESSPMRHQHLAKTV